MKRPQYDHLSTLKVKHYDCVYAGGPQAYFSIVHGLPISVCGRASRMLTHETVKSPANQQSSSDC